MSRKFCFSIQKLKTVILINCGAGMDLIDILQPPEDSVFYLIDSLRPFEVRNVYNGVQVKIIVLPNELSVEQKSVPEFDDIFEEEEGEENENDENVRFRFFLVLC
jgi:cell division control protein 45